MKNNSKLKEVIVRCEGLLHGDSAALHYQRLFDNKALHLLSEASLSRARLKMDVLLCLEQQKKLFDPKQFFIWLSADSSPQGGYELLMTLQDVCKSPLACLAICFGQPVV